MVFVLFLFCLTRAARAARAALLAPCPSSALRAPLPLDKAPNACCRCCHLLVKRASELLRAVFNRFGRSLVFWKGLVENFFYTFEGNSIFRPEICI
jgi:hypothetical protein